MSYLRVSEGLILGSILALSLSSTARAQEQQPASDGAQSQIAVNQAEALKSPDTNTTTAAATNPTTVGPPPNWTFQSLSLLWFPGMSGSVGARGYGTSVHVSPADVLKNFNIGIMGSFEADHHRIGLPFDYVWANLSDKQSLVNFPGYSAKATVKEGFFTPKVTYLVVDGKMLKVRATGGMRIWHLGENLKLNPPDDAPSFSVGTSQNWVDVVAGANIVVPLSPKIFVMVLGDAGAGGANVDYQIATFVNYQWKPKWGLGVGYRYLDVNYRNSNQVVFDTHQSGFALTLLYKYGKQAGPGQ
jgi:hypothetical protein